MVELNAMSAFDGVELPMTAGALTLAEYEVGAMHSVAPFPGQRAKVEALLGALPVGQVEGAVIWSGLEQWFVLGDLPDMAGLAAVTDQSDAWAMLDLTGDGWRSVLARLSPVDAEVLSAGDVARTEVAHMAGIVIGIEGGVRLAVMRSFARSLHHHLADAMRSVVA